MQPKKSVSVHRSHLQALATWPAGGGQALVLSGSLSRGQSNEISWLESITGNLWKVRYGLCRLGVGHQESCRLTKQIPLISTCIKKNPLLLGLVSHQFRMRCYFESRLGVPGVRAVCLEGCPEMQVPKNWAVCLPSEVAMGVLGVWLARKLGGSHG